MNHDDSRGLLKSILGFFARKPPETSESPASLRSRTLDAWVRTDAYLQHDSDNFGEIDPEQVARTLHTFEDLVKYNSDPTPDSVSTHNTQQVPAFQPLNLHPLTQGYGIELTPQCAVPKAPGDPEHDSMSE